MKCVCVIRSFLFHSIRQISHTITNHSIFYRTYESHVMRNFSIMWQSFQFYKMLQREASFCTHAHTLTHNAHVLTYFDVVYSMDLIWFFFFLSLTENQKKKYYKTRKLYIEFKTNFSEKNYEHNWNEEKREFF